LSGGRLLIGLGNELRGDDVAGLLVARAAQRRRPAGIDVIEREGEPIDLIADWERAQAVVVADAVASGGRPGRVHRIDATAAPLPAAFAGPSTHALGLADAIELARALDRLPVRLVVFGIEGAGFVAGAEPAPAVAAAADAVAAEALAELGGAGRPGDRDAPPPTTAFPTAST
jgi:hydrogenase maturation protease